MPAPACAINGVGRRIGGRPQSLLTALGLAALFVITGTGSQAAAKTASSSPIRVTVSGNPAGPLYPGAPPQPIPLTLQNPTSETIHVTKITTGVIDTGALGCEPSWFSTSPLEVPGRGIAIPPKGSVTLTRAGLGEPTIEMVESGTNQSACRDATLTLTYTGTSQTGHVKGVVSPVGSNPSTGSVDAEGALPFTGLLLIPLAAAGVLLSLAGAVVRGRR